MKRFSLLFLCVLGSQTLCSQTTESTPDGAPVKQIFSSDRPGVGSDAPNVLRPGILQVESGTKYAYDQEGENKIKGFQVMNSLLRLGMLPNMELRIAFTYQYVQSFYEGKELSAKGFVPLFLGTKLGICEEKGLRPKVSTSIGVNLPATGSKAFQVSYVIPTITFLTENSLTDYLSITGNFGAEWDAEELQSIGTYAVSADASLTKRWGAFIEFYGTVPEMERADHLFDAGFVFLLKENVQFDISSGVAITEAAQDYFIGLGLSWMLNNHL